jgi:ligand-binding sensor domain-containing protein/signal transduction histidine kinase
MKIALMLSLCGAAALAPGAVAAEDGAPTLEFEHVSLEEGVSHHLIFCLHQDRIGFLWLGTMYGLARFDGRRWVVYRHDPDDAASLSLDDIVCIDEDSEGDLWIGTYGGGVNRLDRATGRFARFLPEGPDSTRVSHGVVWDIRVDGEDRVWVGTPNGLDRIDARRGTVEHWTHAANDPGSLPPGTVRALEVDAHGALWVGTTGGGLARLDPGATSFARFRHDPADTTSLPGDWIGAILEDRAGSLWIGTGGTGLARLDPETGQCGRWAQGDGDRGLGSGWVSRIHQDPDGTLWLGTWAGLERLDPSTGATTRFVHDPSDPTTLRGRSVVAILRDRSGVLWVGTYLGGLDRVAPPGARFPRWGDELTGPLGDAHRDVQALAADSSGTLWIGTRAGLVARKGPGGPARTWMRDPADPGSLGGNLVADVLVAGGDSIWVATNGGLSLLDARTGRIENWGVKPGAPDALEAAATVLLRDRGGQLWIGTAGGGLHRFDSVTGTFGAYSHRPADPKSLGENSVLSLHEDRLGRIWVGTYAGLSRLDAARSAFDRFAPDPADPTSLANAYAYAFHETADGTLWIGTAGGLERFDEAAGTFHHLNSAGGLPNDVVVSILEDDEERLWLGTNRGLCAFDPGSGSVTAWDTRDGLQSNLFRAGAACRLPGGEMAFGGIGGYNAFHPSRMRRNGAPPPVAITRFSAGPDAPAFSPLGGPVTLDHRSRFLTFEFAALDFVAPHRHRFRYRLEGLDRDWIDAGTRAEAAYAGVPPGRYVFRVLGSNADGVWSEDGASLAVTITPPFHGTLAFRAGLVLAAAAAGLIAHRFRLRARLDRERAIERARTQERAAVQQRTAEDFHDELGHRLTKIGLYGEVLRRELGKMRPSAEEWLSRIQSESRHLSDDARDLVWALGPGGESLVDLMKYLQRFGEELFDRTDVRFVVEGLEPDLAAVPLSAESRRQISSIFKEAMNNALRHSGSGRVRLAVRLQGEGFEISLDDDGRGWLPDESRAGHGLRNMELRARRIEATLSVASRPGAGSTVVLRQEARRIPVADDPSRHRRGRR